MSNGRRGGERRQHPPESVCTHSTDERSSSAGDPSFTRSGDPCTSILTTHQKRKQLVVRRTGEHHGWATLGNQEKPALGFSRADGARLAARHRSRKGDSRGVSRKGRRSRPPSLRGSRARVWLPARRSYVAEVGRRRRPRISSANALQKGWQRRVNGGLAGSEGSTGETVDRHLERKGVASRPHR